MYPVAVLWDLETEALEEQFLKLHPDGWRIAAMSKYGTAKQPFHAVLWYQTFGPRQRLVANCDLFEMLFDQVAAQREDGFYPAIASGTGDYTTAYTIVFEELAKFSARVQPPALLGPLPWSEFSKKIGTFHTSLRIRSIDLVRRPRSDEGSSVLGEDDPLGRQYDRQVRRISKDPGLFYMATLWPHDLFEPWAFSSVKIGVAEPDWRWQWPTQVMRIHSEVVAAVGTRSSDEEPEPVLATWQDIRYSPWPVPDAFALVPLIPGVESSGGWSALSDFDRLRVDRSSAQQLDAKFTERFAAGHFPIGISAHGDSVASATFHVVWAPRESSSPLPRKFVRTGPGDGTPYDETQDEHIGVSRVLRSTVRGARATRARRVSELYDDEVLGDGRIWVQPRLPPLPSSTLRGGLQPSGSGGPESASGGHGPVTQAPPPPSPPALDTSFDTTMKQAMRHGGARAAYLVVLRGGIVVFARAYTYAEEGYPITRLHQPFRVASVSKAITATLIVHQARAHAGGLSQRLADVLDVSPQFSCLADATIEHVLRHAAGLETTGEPASYNFHLFDYVNDPPPPGEDPASALEQLGTVRRFYESYDDPGGVPGEEEYLLTGQRTARYNNWNYSLLGEVLSKRADAQEARYDLWPVVIAQMLSHAGGSVDNVLGGRAYPHCRKRDEVLYHTRPGVSRRRWAPEEEPLPFVATPYNQDVDLLGCATAIVIPPLDMAAFLRAMTPRPGRFRWLSAAELDEVRRPDPAIAGSSGLGWGVGAETGWTSRLGGVQRRIKTVALTHNGGLAGSGAWIQHQVPVANYFSLPGSPPPPPLDPADTLSFVYAFNCDAVFDTDAINGRLVAEAQRIELADGWPQGDVLAGAS